MQRIEKDNFENNNERVIEHLAAPAPTLSTCGSGAVSNATASTTACRCTGSKILNNNAVPGTSSVAAIPATKWWCT